MIFAGVCLDYGHGGLVEGAYQTAGNQYTFTDAEDYWIGEGVINRKCAARLMGLLLKSGTRVWDAVAQREWTWAPSWCELEQADVRLDARTDYANRVEANRRVEGFSLFLSLHSNAVGALAHGPSQPARGVSFYTAPGESTADAVASTLHAAFCARLAAEDFPMRSGDWADGDVDHEARLWVLRRTTAPAVLGEVGFFTNLTDARFLDSERGQQIIAESYFAGIQSWLVRG